MSIKFYKTEFEANWHDNLNEAVKFYSSTDRYLPQSNTSLYRWLSAQYNMYIKGELSNERAYYLSVSIPNFELVLSKYKDAKRGATVSFDERLEEFKQYLIENETPIIPVRTELGVWANDIRKLYLYNKLTNDKIEKLISAGFVFNVQDYQWDLKYQKLCVYYSIHNHCNVSARDKDFIDLYKWLLRQRILYKEKSLSLDRQKKLDSIGMQWDLFDYKWEIKYLKLCEFYNRYNNCNVTKDHIEYYGILNQWIQTQRKDYEKGILALDRKERLSKINFIWNYHDYIWNKKYVCVRYYLRKYPGKQLPKEAKYNLYAWFKYNKKLFLSNKLDKNKIRRMKSLLTLEEDL